MKSYYIQLSQSLFYFKILLRTPPFLSYSSEHIYYKGDITLVPEGKTVVSIGGAISLTALERFALFMEALLLGEND